MSEILSSPAALLLGLIASLLTLALILVSGAKAAMTKPKVRLEFSAVPNDSDGVLTCHFYNDPLSGWPFSSLNVKKQNIDEFSLLASVVDEDGARVCEIWAPLHDRIGKHDEVHPLPASPYGLSAPILKLDQIGASVIDADSGIRTYLPPGTYDAGCCYTLTKSMCESWANDSSLEPSRPSGSAGPIG